MNWNKIEEITGHTIIFAAVAGSRLYNIHTERSDYDYVVFVLFNNSDNNKLYQATRAYHFPEAGEGDVFFRDALIPGALTLWCSVWTVPTYTNIVYANKDIASFLQLHKQELSNLWPYRTYCLGASFCQQLIEIGTRKQLMIALYCGAVLYNFMNTGDFFTSVYLNNDFFTIYQDVRDNFNDTSQQQVQQFLSFLWDETTEIFFREFPFKSELYQKYLDAIAEVNSNYAGSVLQS